ncbi:AraC family transcriptional regulator [Vallitalea sediminicola]
MKTNYENILYLIDLIEEDLSQNNNLESLAKKMGYSKYHLNKMFTNVVGMSVHQYIKNRRLSETAKKLMCTHDSILDIALNTGYESQQAFTEAFKAKFRMSPKTLRHKMRKLSLTPRFISSEHTFKMNINFENCNEMILAGFSANTLKGFFVIPRLWKKLNKSKVKIRNRISKNWVYGLNDYENAKQKTDGNLSFNYTACVEVDNKRNDDENMVIKELQKSRYVIFAFRAKPHDSIESVLDYIYQEWFPSTTYQLNEQAKYDIVKYGEIVDEQGIADIKVMVPIVSENKIKTSFL